MNPSLFSAPYTTIEALVISFTIHSIELSRNCIMSNFLRQQVRISLISSVFQLIRSDRLLASGFIFGILLFLHFLSQMSLSFLTLRIFCTANLLSPSSELQSIVWKMLSLCAFQTEE